MYQVLLYNAKKKLMLKKVTHKIITCNIKKNGKSRQKNICPLKNLQLINY